MKLTMPWSSAHMFTAPGGVFFNGRAIAVYYEEIWHQLLTGKPGPLRVGNVTPANGETGVTPDFQPAQIQAGPRGGGSTKRILATFSTALDPMSVSADTFRLYDEDGERVAPMDGFPRMGRTARAAASTRCSSTPPRTCGRASATPPRPRPASADWFGQHLAKPLRLELRDRLLAVRLHLDDLLVGRAG